MTYLGGKIVAVFSEIGDQPRFSHRCTRTTPPPPSSVGAVVREVAGSYLDLRGRFTAKRKGMEYGKEGGRINIPGYGAIQSCLE